MKQKTMSNKERAIQECLQAVERFVIPLTPEEIIELWDKAERGARLLDAIKPGWADRIIISELNLSTCDACVLGQIYRGRLEEWMETTHGVLRDWAWFIDQVIQDAEFACMDSDISDIYETDGSSYGFICEDEGKWTQYVGDVYHVMGLIWSRLINERKEPIQ